MTERSDMDLPDGGKSYKLVVEGAESTVVAEYEPDHGVRPRTRAKRIWRRNCCESSNPRAMNDFPRIRSPSLSQTCVPSLRS